MSIERFLLPGSERAPRAGAAQVGAPESWQSIEVSIVLRRRAPLDLSTLTQPVGRREFAAQYGADQRDVERIEAFAQQFDLYIVEVDLGRRTVVVGGTVAAMNEAFGTSLALYQSEFGLYRGRTGPLYLPMSLQDAVIAVLGLDDRPVARVRSRRHLTIAANAAASTSYTPTQVAALYQFPAGLTGAGQTVAIIELGGGYKAADLTTYFKGLGLKTPSVTALSVDRAKNAPTGDPGGPDGEVLLDIEIVGSIANGAKIAVYFAPNTDQGFLDAVTTAVHDATRRPAIVSISWGGAESTWTSQSLTSYDAAFQDAAALGVTVCCASGDSGSSDGVTDGHAHVDFPASSPHVLACGGTHVASANGKLSGEVVWNGGTSGGATGGGVSEVFARPAFQQNAHVPVSVNSSHYKGRGVPDVAGDADPASGYQVRVDGHDAVYGGTSAVAPLWAALVALLNQRRGSSLGYLHTSLYSVGAQACRDITSGNNGAYSAAVGWDACTGLGSPNGTALATLLGSASGAAEDR
jgi:kumamolisin